MAGNELGSAVERQDPPRVVRRRQPAWQAVDDVLIEGLQVRDLARGLLQTGASRSDALRQRAAEQRDSEEPERVEDVNVLGDRPLRQYGRRQPGVVEITRHRQVLSQDNAT